MGEVTGISWCDHTFNPWRGCQAVSAACDHCYAKTLVERWGGDFSNRQRTTPQYWKQPIRWNRKAQVDGVRRRVFCASLADVFDNKVSADWRADLWALISETPHLDWLLLTKRPQNIAKMLPGAYVEQIVGRDLPRWPWPNVWLGTTVENDIEHDRRVPILRAIPAAVRFLSCEPMLGRVVPDLRGIHWVIAGGESGPGARQTPMRWIAGLRFHAACAGTAFFMKQAGSNRGPDWPQGITGKGDDPAQWPEVLRVQEFPACLPCLPEVVRRTGVG